MNWLDKKTGKEKRKIVLIASFSFLFVLLILYKITPASLVEIYPSQKTENAKIERKIVFQNIPLLNESEDKPLKENILVLGRAGQGYAGGNLTDTILLVHISQFDSVKKSALISLPRDLLVRIPESQSWRKINSLYALVGINGLKNKIEEITGLSVDRYIVVDLAVVEEIINLIDGLNVYVKEDINDPYFPGPNYTYQTFNLSAGWRYLDGPTALRYIRTRYTSPNGDFDRMTRQQQVIQLLKQKVLALNPLWDFPTYLKIFDSLNKHIETDLSILEMKTLYQIAKEIGADQIKSGVIDEKNTELLTGGQVPLGEQTASVVYPKAGQENYSVIKDFIKKILE